MTTPDLRTTILDVLSDVAPELEREKIDPRIDLREQLDLDSMDFLNFVLGLHKAFGVEIPEADYRKIATLDGCMAYLAAKAKPVDAPSTAA
jgi:acyl carrier protein